MIALSPSSMNKLEPLDPVIHAPVRLSIMTILISVRAADFNYLKEATGGTDGNLSVHLDKLARAKYLKAVKRFVAKKPRTTCSITDIGRSAYESYLATLERYIDRSLSAGRG